VGLVPPIRHQRLGFQAAPNKNRRGNAWIGVGLAGWLARALRMRWCRGGFEISVFFFVFGSYREMEFQ
jgi:hypothetical protein